MQTAQSAKGNARRAMQEAGEIQRSGPEFFEYAIAQKRFAANDCCMQKEAEMTAHETRPWLPAAVADRINEITLRSHNLTSAELVGRIGVWIPDPALTSTRGRHIVQQPVTWCQPGIGDGYRAACTGLWSQERIRAGPDRIL